MISARSTDSPCFISGTIALLLLFTIGCGKQGGDPVTHRSGTGAMAPPPASPLPAAVEKQVVEKAPFAHQMFPTAQAALAHVLDRTKPDIIAFGEFHQVSATAKVVSALNRFTDDLLPLLVGRIADLVVETWVSTGSCGKVEKAVTKDVDKVSDRPAVTEDETVRMIKRAAAFGIRPHVLDLKCDDYKDLQGDAGVDYLKLLELVAKRIGDKTEMILGSRAKPPRSGRAKDDAAGDPEAIAIYGGAIHNDAEPDEMWQSVTFGPELKKAVSGRYVEIDLFVPEFIKESAIARKERWFPLFKEKVSRKEALLIELSQTAFIIVFPSGMTK